MSFNADKVLINTISKAEWIHVFENEILIQRHIMELNFLSATFWINFINTSFIVWYPTWKKLSNFLKSSKELSKLIISLSCFEIQNCCNKSIINFFFDDKTYYLKTAGASLYAFIQLCFLFLVILNAYWTYHLPNLTYLNYCTKQF